MPTAIVPLRGKRPKSFAACVLQASTNVCEVDAAALHAVGVDQVDAVFDAGDAVGNLGEIVAAHFLLAFEIERRVVGGDRADGARGERVPNCILIRQRPERRRHHVFRPFEVRLLSVGRVEHQIRRHRFDPHVHAPPPGGDGRLNRIVVAGVDDVDVRAQSSRRTW